MYKISKYVSIAQDLGLSFLKRLPINYIIGMIVSYGSFMILITTIYLLNIIDQNVFILVKNIGLMVLTFIFIGLPLLELLTNIFKNLSVLKFSYFLPDNCYIEKRDDEYFIQPLEASSMHEKLKMIESFPDSIKIPKRLLNKCFYQVARYNAADTGRFEKLDGKFYLVFSNTRHLFSLTNYNTFHNFYYTKD